MFSGVPRKEDDELGQATPRMVMASLHRSQSLMSLSGGMRHYKSVNKVNMQEKLLKE